MFMDLFIQFFLELGEYNYYRTGLERNKSSGNLI